MCVVNMHWRCARFDRHQPNSIDIGPKVARSRAEAGPPQKARAASRALHTRPPLNPGSGQIRTPGGGAISSGALIERHDGASVATVRCQRRTYQRSTSASAVPVRYRVWYRCGRTGQTQQQVMTGDVWPYTRPYGWPHGSKRRRGRARVRGPMRRRRRRRSAARRGIGGAASRRSLWTTSCGSARRRRAPTAGPRSPLGTCSAGLDGRLPTAPRTSMRPCTGPLGDRSPVHRRKPMQAHTPRRSASSWREQGVGGRAHRGQPMPMLPWALEAPGFG